VAREMVRKVCDSATRRLRDNPDLQACAEDAADD
jgi:hypothetical protein